MPSRLLDWLCRRGGEWISLAGGWYIGRRAFLSLQLNDRTCRRESVSLVFAVLSVEQLSNRGIRDPIFWDGTTPPLSFYTAPREEVTAYTIRSAESNCQIESAGDRRRRERFGTREQRGRRDSFGFAATLGAKGITCPGITGFPCLSTTWVNDGVPVSKTFHT
jgi:hypothetical protein